MFECFTEKAIMALSLAKEEARRVGCNYVAAEQILLGLIAAEDGLSFSALTGVGLELEMVRIELAKIKPNSSEIRDIEVPFSSSAKRLLELARTEARELGHTHIGTEHLLLGMLRIKHSVIEKALENLGVDGIRLQRHVLARIAEMDRQRAAFDSHPI